MTHLIWACLLFALFLVNWHYFEKDGNPLNLIATVFCGIATFMQILAYGQII